MALSLLANSAQVIGKIYRRSLEAPWEFLPIGAGAVEVSVDELLWVKTVQQRDNQFVVDSAKGLTHFVKLGWRPVPKHCKLYRMLARGRF